MIFSICKSICNLPWLPVIAAVEEGSTQPWTAAERLPCNSCARQTSVCTFFAFSLSFCLLPLFPSFFIYHSVFFFLLLILQFTPLCPESFPICTVYYYLHKGAITFGLIFWVGIFKGQSHISQVYFTSRSESVSEWVRIVSYSQRLQRSDSGPTKMSMNNPFLWHDRVRSL